MAPLYEHGTLKAKDGLDLYFCKDIPDNPKAVVVVVHGLAEHCGRYDYVTRAFNQAGYGVYRFDNRGHGRSGGERAYVDSFHDYFDDADVVVEKARADYPNLPVFLLGHSMGGFIAAGYGAKYPGKLRGEVFSGAAVRPLPAFAFLDDMENYRARGREALPNALGHLVSRDPAVVRDYAADPLVLKSITLQLAGAVWKDGVAWVGGHAAFIDAPCLILHGGDDRIVPPDASQWLHGNVSSRDKTLKMYPGLYHEIMNEREKDEVLTDIVDWLDAHA